MQLRLKTKITLTMTLLVLVVVGVNSTLYLMTLTRQVIRQANERAQVVTKNIFFQIQKALADSIKEGKVPTSDSAEDLRAYLQSSLEDSASLQSSIKAEAGSSPLIYEISVTDANGKVLSSSDLSLPEEQLPERPKFQQLVTSSFWGQIRTLYGPSKSFQVSYKFDQGPEGNKVPFGAIHVALQTALLRNEITPALRSAALLALGSVVVSGLLAGFLSNLLLSPLQGIEAQLDRISKGESDQKPLQRGDEFGQVSTKISQIGMQLRGVREIFNNQRENFDLVLSVLDDGLLFFDPDGRAVNVSPAMERFLSIPSDRLLGKRAEDIFPPDHPVRDAIKLVGGEFQPVAATELILAGPNMPPRRVGLSVQVIAAGGTRMGALLKFTDLESRERISTQLQVSDRIAQLGRITAGVAHEVKNPLNSMRLWLENLKASLPSGDDLPQQAVRVLDNEIDRLDNVVKRFLDFTRPQEMHQEEASLKNIFEEVLNVQGPQMAKANIKVVTRFAEVPPVLVDRELLKQALVNLLVNAVEAMPNGGVLTLTLARHGEMAEMQIGDTGRGIAPENKQRVFQLFFTTRPKGSGIGLASTFRTVQLHNGSIEFDSEVGRGTTFRIQLPLARQLESVATRARETSAAVVRNS